MPTSNYDQIYALIGRNPIIYPWVLNNADIQTIYIRLIKTHRKTVFSYQMIRYRVRIHLFKPKLTWNLKNTYLLQAQLGMSWKPTGTTNTGRASDHSRKQPLAWTTACTAAQSMVLGGLWGLYNRPQEVSQHLWKCNSKRDFKILFHGFQITEFQEQK